MMNSSHARQSIYRIRMLVLFYFYNCLDVSLKKKFSKIFVHHSFLTTRQSFLNILLSFVLHKHTIFNIEFYKSVYLFF